MTITQDIFWTKYTEFDNKIGSFDADKFIWKTEDITDGNSHLWHQIYLLSCTKVLVFLHAESHKTLLELVKQSVLVVI